MVSINLRSEEKAGELERRSSGYAGRMNLGIKLSAVVIGVSGLACRDVQTATSCSGRRAWAKYV